MQQRRRLFFGLLCLTLVLILAERKWESHYLQWVFPARIANIKAPALGRNGLLFVHSDLMPITALDALTGHPRWTFALFAEHEQPITETVVSDDNMVYLGSAQNGTPFRLYALDGATGKINWFTSEEVATPILGENHQIFVGLKHMLALDNRTGRRQWTFQPPAPTPPAILDSNAPGTIEAAAYADGTVFVSFDRPYKRLFALDAATGKPRWSMPFQEQAQSPFQTQSVFAVTGHHRLIVGDYSSSGGTIQAFDGRTGHPQWKFQTTDGDPLNFYITSGEGVVYLSSVKGHVYALEETTGALKWEFRINEEVLAPPVLNGHGTLYVGTDDSYIHAFDAATGKVTWNYYFPWPTPYVHHSIAITTGPTGMIYAASTDGYLYAFKRP